MLPYSIQCHPHRGGRRIYACVDKILLHTSARFDQSKAIRWRGWGRLASAFRELPWNFGPCFHLTFAKLANAFIRLGRFDEAVAAARKSLRKSQTYTGGLSGRGLRKDPICFSPYLYRARNLIERFFNKISNVGVSRPDTTNSRPTVWRSCEQFDIASDQSPIVSVMGRGGYCYECRQKTLARQGKERVFG